MKRHRKRSNTFYAMLLSTVLAVGLIAPAAAGAISKEGQDETDEVEGIEEDADECVLHVDLEGDVLSRDLYERPGLKYKKQVETFRTEYTYDKEKWVSGVKQYNYKKETRSRDWVPAQRKVVEHKWQKQERIATDLHEWKRWEVQKQFFTGSPLVNGGTGIGAAYWLTQGQVTNQDPLTINPLGTHDAPRVVGVSRFNVTAGSPQYVASDSGTYIYRLTNSGSETAASAPGGPGWIDYGKVGVDYGPWTDVGDLVQTATNTPPGSDTDTEQWLYKGSVVVQNAVPGHWGPWGDWGDFSPPTVTGWFDGKQTTLSGLPGGPWTVGQAKYLGGNFSKQYRYVQNDWQWKPGTNTWVPFAQDLGPTATAPSTAPFWIFGTLYKYTNIQGHEVHSGWTWFTLGGEHFTTDWLNPGDQIGTGIPSVGLVDPDEEFDHNGKTYRYVAWKTRSMEEWVVEDVAGGGTTPPEGEGWVKTDTEVIDPEPNMVRVTINGEVEEEATFGESYTGTFLLDHGDSYLVEYKLHQLFDDDGEDEMIALAVEEIVEEEVEDDGWILYAEGVADCTMPDADVAFSEWEEGELACGSEFVTLTRTKSTTPFDWDPETRTWIEDLENVIEGKETDQRDLTPEEIEWQEGSDCVEVLDEVEEVEEEPEVEDVAVKRTVETKVLAATLPRTGASVIALLVTGLLALFAGGGALSVRRGSER